MTTPPPPGPDPAGGNGSNRDGGDAAVVALARDAEQIRTQVKALESRLTELANTVVRLAEATGRNHATATDGDGEDDKDELVSWLDLPHGPDHAEQVLTDLADWVARVYLRYPDAAGLPECWLWHPHAVEELVWLRHAWAAAYPAESGSPTLAGDWHDRYRPGVVRRIQTSIGTCSLAAHQPRHGRPRPSTPPGTPLPEAVPQIAAWWGNHRNQPAPEPTTDQLAAADAYIQRRDHHPHERGPR